MAGDRRVRLSQRMEALAALVTPQGVVADVGTDHGYLPIALVSRQTAPSAIAMDVREGPLSRARENIAQAGLSDRIETRLSDGVAALLPGEADSVIIAGMGGELVLHILTAGSKICRGVRELILQPQSQIPQVRTFLIKNGYCLTDENMIIEEGKYYPMLRAVPQETANGLQRADCAQLSELQLAYGPLLLRDRNPVLGRYLGTERRQLLEVKRTLEEHSYSARSAQRYREICHSLALNEEAALLYSI